MGEIQSLTVLHRMLIICTATALCCNSCMDDTSTMAVRMAYTMVHWLRAGIAHIVSHYGRW
jgi:hypothetical protein